MEQGVLLERGCTEQPAADWLVGEGATTCSCQAPDFSGRGARIILPCMRVGLRLVERHCLDKRKGDKNSDFAKSLPSERGKDWAVEHAREV